MVALRRLLAIVVLLGCSNPPVPVPSKPTPTQRHWGTRHEDVDWGFIRDTLLPCRAIYSHRDHLPANMPPYLPTLLGLKGWERKQLDHLLCLLGEPRLRETTTATYRFIRERPLQDSDCIRIEVDRLRVTLTAKHLPAQLHPGDRVATPRIVTVTRTEYDKLLAEVERSRFWTLPATTGVSTTHEDSNTWVFEAKTDRYHAVARRSGDMGEIEELGKMMLWLAGVDPDLSGWR
jgi:hypothetical protein